MASLKLDQGTAEQLRTLAAASGMSVEAYLKLLLPATANGNPVRLTFEELESLLSQHEFDGPSLPADFARADIYNEHD